MEESEEMKAGFPSQAPSPRPGSPASGLRGCLVCHIITIWRGRAYACLARRLSCSGCGADPFLSLTQAQGRRRKGRRVEALGAEESGLGWQKAVARPSPSGVGYRPGKCLPASV